MNGDYGMKAGALAQEVEHIKKLANDVRTAADELKTVADKISAKGIQGVSWYDGTFKTMLGKLKEDKVTAVGEVMEKTSISLDEIKNEALAFSNKQ